MKRYRVVPLPRSYLEGCTGLQSPGTGRPACFSRLPRPKNVPKKLSVQSVLLRQIPVASQPEVGRGSYLSWPFRRKTMKSAPPGVRGTHSRPAITSSPGGSARSVKSPIIDEEACSMLSISKVGWNMSKISHEWNSQLVSVR